MRAEFKALEILYGVTVWVASCRGARVVSGQTVCHGGPEKPCYKIAYFSEVSSRVAFWEAQQVCEVDSGSLLSLENVAEQQHIEQLLKNLSRTSSGPGIADGDFWIGLTRVDSGSPGESASYTSCPDLYRWTDGSVSQFRNWYFDEPSCGGEACVVMYHQPSAQLGLGGPYLYQWNDDRCNMKHNFICKYEPARLKSSSFTSISRVTEKPEKGKVLKTSLWRKTAPVLKNELTPSDQSDSRIHQCCGLNVVNTESHLVKEHGDRPARGHAEHEEQTKSPDVHDEKSLHVTVAGHSSVLLIYVIIPTIPLLLLILVASGTCCFQMLSKRRPRTKTSVDQSTLWISKAPKSDSAMEV